MQSQYAFTQAICNGGSSKEQLKSGHGKLIWNWLTNTGAPGRNDIAAVVTAQWTVLNLMTHLMQLR